MLRQTYLISEAPPDAGVLYVAQAISSSIFALSARRFVPQVVIVSISQTPEGLVTLVFEAEPGGFVFVRDALERVGLVITTPAEVDAARERFEYKLERVRARWG